METVIKRSDLEKYEDITMRIYNVNGVIYKLLKIYEYSDWEEIEELKSIVHYLQKETNFPRLTKPIEIFKCLEGQHYRYGITMEYLKDYNELGEIIRIFNINEKKMYFNYIADILNKIKKSGIAYNDIHGANIMLGPSYEIRFVDPDSVKICGIHDDFETFVAEEKLRFSELVLQELYSEYLSHNCNEGHHLSDKLKSFQVSNELLDYIKTIENGSQAEGYITDFEKDLENDVITFNKRLADSMGIF